MFNSPQMNRSNAAVLASGVVLVVTAAALLAYAAWPQLNKKRTAQQSGASQEAKAGDASAPSGASPEEDGGGVSGSTISKAALCEIFNEITNEMGKVIMHIGQMEQALYTQAAETGKQIDPDRLRESLLQEFTMEVKEAEAAVYAKHGVTQGDVEAAAKYFHDDADFQTAVKTLKRKFALFTGQPGDDVPEHVTMELIMAVLSETMMKMTAAMEEVYNQTKERSPVGSDAFNAQLQSAYVERVGVIRQKVQKKFGIDQVRCCSLSVHPHWPFGLHRTAPPARGSWGAPSLEAHAPHPSKGSANFRACWHLSPAQHQTCGSKWSFSASLSAAVQL